MSTQTYRGYNITEAEPESRCRYKAVHENYDGPGDNRIVYATTMEDIIDQINDQVIDSLEKELEWHEKQTAKMLAEKELVIAKLKEDLDNTAKSLRKALPLVDHRRVTDAPLIVSGDLKSLHTIQQAVDWYRRDIDLICDQQGDTKQRAEIIQIADKWLNAIDQAINDEEFEN